ncbi:putative transcription factor C2H2 family [Lupinus albus]|uniref:Putative transcription factor C2H2 family n=1 Tax=Lupinus albus TaxID=3870 RepID=A0A6A4R813_LUPAL|nr:putative transcription factor C2H2 family [Lupinus albus]
MDTRRSLDRSRVIEPGAKKPRLINELDRGSILGPPPLPRRQAASGVTKFASARFGINGRDFEKSDSGRGGGDDDDGDDDDGGYHPQPPPHQELVVQYKTALAELTFNSKPIITNLTIIAGENVAAAKAVAGIVCSNIIEVPSEQKLPSLYLLDSIVKNIGRDYIKYFADRLPEVFCEAYRQVDPRLQSSMRHLFGTWKGVFPTQTLQMIEKELGFTSAANGSASTSASVRSNSQSQPPPNSIHVNPKYLERQRLQQSITTKGGVNDMNEAILNSKEDPERALGSARPLLDPRITMQNNLRINRDAFNDSVPEKNIRESYGGNQYSSDTSSKLSLVAGRTFGRVTELGHDKPWYKAGVVVAETRSGQGNDFSLKPGFSNHEALKSTKLDTHCQPTLNMTNKRSRAMSSNWKNSEEEEFTWDEMNSGLTGHGASNVSNNLSTDTWTADDENLEGEDHLQIAHPSGAKVEREIFTVKKQLPAFVGHQSLSWKLQDQHSNDKLNLKPGHSQELLSNPGGFPTNTNSLSVGMQNRSFMPNAMIGMTEVMRQQKFVSAGAESPSLPVNVRHPHQMQNLAEQDRPQTRKASQYLGSLQSQHIRDPSIALPPNVQVGNLQRSQERDLQGPLSLATSFQPKIQQKLGPSQSEVTVKSKKPPESKVALARKTSEQSTTSSMSGATVKKGISPKKSIISSLPTTSSLDTRNLQPQLEVRPTRSSGPSPTTLISSVSVVASPSSLGPLNDDSPTLPKITQRKAGQSPMGSTQLPASSNGSSARDPPSTASNNNTSNPIANLLSSLVAKGLISSETESPAKVPTEVPSQLEEKTESIAASSSSPVASVSVSAAVGIPSSRDEVDDTAKSSLALSKSTSMEIKNLIGFDFKPDVIREMHPPVISTLLDDLPHHCTICGTRLKLQEQFDRHLEWHATREKEQSGLITSSRKWYVKSNDWIAAKDEYPSQYELTDSVDVHDMEKEENQLDAMVLADENQCLCVLCGELFEDVYCQERDEWMFKGAAYLNNTDDNNEMESRNPGPIIHTKCLSSVT